MSTTFSPGKKLATVERHFLNRFRESLVIGQIDGRTPETSAGNIRSTTVALRIDSPNARVAISMGRQLSLRRRTAR